MQNEDNTVLHLYMLSSFTNVSAKVSLSPRVTCQLHPHVIAAKARMVRKPLVVNTKSLFDACSANAYAACLLAT